MIQKGFYFHYKRDQNGEPNNYAYEIIGTGLDTETNAVSVIYRPLYKSDHLGNNDWYIRPATMFDEFVEVNDRKIKRFELITDQAVIDQLKIIRDDMYKK